MSFKGFKKTGQDDKTTTFRHPNGSELKVAHGHISPELKKRLDGLPMHMASGGASSGGGGEDEGATDDDNTSATQPQAPVTINIAPSGQAQQQGQTDTPPVPGSPASQADIKANPGPIATTGTNLNNPGAQPPDNSVPIPVGQGAPAATPAPAPKPPYSFITEPASAPEISQDMNQQYAAMKQDFATGQIKPETYQDLFHSKDLPGKIGTLFGLLVSGAGAGLTHQPNAVLAMMDKQIDNDLKAKMATKGNQLSGMQAIDNHLRSMSEASLTGPKKGLIAAQTQEAKANAALTGITTHKAAMMLGLLQDLTGKVSTIPPGPQKQAAEGALSTVSSGIDQKMGQDITQTAAQIEANWQRKNALKNMVIPEQAKYEAERHVPGVGEASVPVTGEDREALQSGQAFDQKLQRFIDWTKQHGETAALHPVDRRVGETMAAELQGAYRQATHGGVYKEGEQNFISKLIASDPVGNLNKFTVVPQLEALQKENQERVSQKAESLGLPGYSQSAQQASKSKSASGEVRYDKQGNAWKLGPSGKPVRVQ